MKKVDVIIPVYKPGKKLLGLMDMLQKQTAEVSRIILINTEKQYFERLMPEEAFKKKYDNVVIEHITKAEFDHGKTRNFGVGFSHSPYFVMMTDDAVPADESLLERLLSPFADEAVGMTYARQLPAEGCGIIESYTRDFNYPAESKVKSAADLKAMGIKTFFASNVCAAYRREYFDGLGGFTDRTIFNEDMIYARKLIDAGKKIVYAADARVYHSHNYSGIEQLRRNFDLGVSHAEYAETFSGLSTESEGIRLVKKTCAYLCKAGKPWLIIKLIWQSGCKYIGYFLGKRYQSLPKKMVKRLSMNKEYWKDL
ncbi:MAG: glycosyltransferase family 2 protein [Lachnospiraceae bacterium]|nr:glycosyltransferase family 2 protein [Lachnospiraceae bacterium]